MDFDENCERLALILEAAAAKLRDQRLAVELLRRHKGTVDTALAQVYLLLKAAASVEESFGAVTEEKPKVRKTKKSSKKHSDDEEWPDLIL